jgi:hypothetical protein
LNEADEPNRGWVKDSDLRSVISELFFFFPVFFFFFFVFHLQSRDDMLAAPLKVFCPLPGTGTGHN